MSYHDRYSSSRDGREYSRHSSSRRSPPPRHHRSRRSPSPGPSRSRNSPRPRDPQNLPESFGRVQDSGRADDDLNILQRMKTSYHNSPLADLYACVKEHRKVKIWTRNYKEVRGVMTGYIIAFDKHWNLILKDVDEVFFKQKKSKTPFLRDVAANENLPDMPVKVPKVKKTDAEKAESAAAQQKPSESESETAEKSEKKKKRKKKNKRITEKRHIDQVFVRGDNVVMICTVLESGPSDDVEESHESD